MRGIELKVSKRGVLAPPPPPSQSSVSQGGEGERGREGERRVERCEPMKV